MVLINWEESAPPFNTESTAQAELTRVSMASRIILLFNLTTSLPYAVKQKQASVALSSLLSPVVLFCFLSFLELEELAGMSRGVEPRKQGRKLEWHVGL